MKFRSSKSKDEYLAHYEESAKKWPVSSEDFMIDTPPYGVTYIRVSGPLDARPLILLPGAHANSLMWIDNIEVLSKEHRVFVVDPIFEHGKSVANKEAKTPAELVHWLDTLFDCLGFKESVDICGMSLGGWVSTQYALARPDRIRRLILLAPAATVLRLRFIFLLRGILAGLIPIRWFSLNFAAWLLNLNDKKNPENIALVDDLGDSMFIATKSYKVPVDHPIPTVISDSDLQALSKVQTLFMIGEHDQMYSTQKAISRLRRLAPKMNIELIQGAGHALVRTHSNSVNEGLSRFLRHETDAM
ncbi:MAG: alpha/beta hydrolase [Kangiellaceae bacterium]|nr:alpha/beta hydrolase [Kangiellaceae bacterium]